MNNSETPTGVNGRKELKVTESDVDLFTKWFEEYKEEKGKYYALDCLTFDVPKVAIKENNATLETSEIQDIVGNAMELIKDPAYHITASRAPSRTEKNAKAYDREREKAKTEGQNRIKASNEKIEEEKKSANIQDRER